MANKSFVVRYIIQAKDQFAAQAAKVSKATEKMRRSIKGAQRELGNLSRKMRDVGARASAFMTAPILLAANSLKNAARDGEETRSKFATVFKSMSGKAEGMADSLARSYGLASVESRKLLGDTGDILTGFGFSEGAALDLSNQVNELAVDLASFTNFSGGASGASQALTKALLGEAESVKALGIVIRQDTKEYKDLVNNIVRTKRVSLLQAKALAALKIATDQSKNAIGDFARTSASLANQERITTARINDLKESLGRRLMPIALRVTTVIRDMVDFIGELSPKAKGVIFTIAGIAAAIGPIMLALSAITIALSPLGLLALAIAAAALVIIKNWDKVVELFSGLSRGINSTLGPTMDGLISKFKEAAKIVVEMFGGDSEAAKAMTDFANIGELIGGIIGGALDVIIRGISGVGAILGQLAAAAINLDFSQFDIDAIKAEFLGPQSKTPADISNAGRVDVGVQVGLDQGLQQTSKPVVGGSNVRRTDVGMVAG